MKNYVSNKRRRKKLTKAIQSQELFTFILKHHYTNREKCSGVYRPTALFRRSYIHLLFYLQLFYKLFLLANKNYNLLSTLLLFYWNLLG